MVPFEADDRCGPENHLQGGWSRDESREIWVFVLGQTAHFAFSSFRKVIGDFSLVNSWKLAAGISSTVLSVSPIQLYWSIIKKH